MAAPVTTQNPYGNLVTNVAILPSGISGATVVDATQKFEAQMQFDILTGGAAQAGATAIVKIYRLFGLAGLSDTVPITQLQITLGTVSTHFTASVAMPTGKYGVTVTNGDTANSINYWLTLSTIDSIS